MRRSARSRPRRRYRVRNLRRVQHHHRFSRHFEAHPCRQRNGCSGRRAIESVSPRARYRPPVSQAGRDGRRRRLPRLGLHRHAARTAAGPERGAGARHDPLCRGGRRPARGIPEGRRFGQAEACLQLSERHAGHGRRGDPGAAAPRGDQGRRALHELRRRTRLPVPVQLLHHHQRPGAQVALSDSRRCRGDRARQRRAGRHPLFRHRRQFRPQPQLGADPRSADRIAGEPGLSDQASASGRYALPQDSGLHREGGARGLQRRLHRA